VRLMVWTVPRAISTAFERALIEHPETSVHHEPFALAWYYGPERVSSRYAHTPPRAGATCAEGVARLLADPCPYTIAKVMAYCAIHRLDEIPLRDFSHAALIRDPARTVRSLWRASHDTEGTGWDHFEEREIGYTQLESLLEQAEAQTGHAPVILDADELLTAPAAGMAAWCRAVGLPYTEAMLTWEPGPVPGWEAWPGWHDAALKSSGLRQRDRTEPPPPPPHLAAYIERATPIYQRLYARRLTF